MPMGIVSDEDFQKELENSETEIIIPEVLPIIKPGRKLGNNNVPSGLRNIIGETHEIEGRPAALEVAKEWGISPSSVSAYANGARSTTTYDNQVDISHINKAKERISKKARFALRRAISHITEDKLKASDAKDLASVARGMAAVVKDMAPDVEGGGSNNGPSFIIYAPQVTQENHYETITSRE